MGLTGESVTAVGGVLVASFTIISNFTGVTLPTIEKRNCQESLAAKWIFFRKSLASKLLNPICCHRNPIESDKGTFLSYKQLNIHPRGEAGPEASFFKTMDHDTVLHCQPGQVGVSDTDNSLHGGGLKLCPSPFL